MNYQDIPDTVWKLLDGIIAGTANCCGPATVIALDDKLIVRENGVYRLDDHGAAAIFWREQQLLSKKKGKPGRPTELDDARDIVEEFDEGKRNGEWKTQVEYLRKCHAKRYREKPEAAKSWFSMMKKRVKDAGQS